MRLRVIVSAAAEHDLAAIWLEGRAGQHLYRPGRSSHLACRRYARLTRPADDVRAGLRRFNADSHVLFARVTDTTIRVVRILHGRMAGHL